MERDRETGGTRMLGWPGRAVALCLGITAALLVYAFADMDGARKAVAEDGPLETAQALLFLAGGAVWLYASARLSKGGRDRAFRLVFAAIWLFLFLEEISYGQRLLGFETPEALESSNFQGESNLHNLGSGNYDAWILATMGGFVVLVGLIMPYVKALGLPGSGLLERLRVPVMDPCISPVFYLVLLVYSFPGFQWFVPLVAIAAIAPLVLLATGALDGSHARCPKPWLHYGLVALLGLVVVAANLSDTYSAHLDGNVAYELRELIMAGGMLVFSVDDIKRRA